MKQAAHIQTAIDILTTIGNSKIPMDNVIRDYMHHRRYVGSKDRAAIVERVYGVVRRHARLGWWLEKAGTEDSPRTRVIADLVLSVQDITNLFTGEKYAPEKLSEEERKMVSALKGQDINDPSMPASVRGECPDWAVDKLKDLFKENFENQMAAMLQPAPLDLRVNTLKGTREKAKDFLGAQDVQTVDTPFSPVGLRAQGKAFMSATKAYSKGLVEIQDEGSQLIALVSGVKPGMRVLDYCAGAGGKTLGLAAIMENKGNIVAADIDARRLEKGRKRYRKAGVHNVELRCLSNEKDRKWLRRQKGTMDIVLVDAPCSSSGTWRRNPDLRWYRYGPSLEEIKEMQADILERAANKVKVGGRLIYATCSLFQEENEQQIESFLKKHPEYALLPLKEALPKEINLPCESPYLRLFPYDHNTDGFFTAILIRKNI